WVSVLRTPSQVKDTRTAAVVSRSHWAGETDVWVSPGSKRVMVMGSPEVECGRFSCRKDAGPCDWAWAAQCRRGSKRPDWWRTGTGRWPRCAAVPPTQQP